MQQAEDFRAESAALAAIVQPLDMMAMTTPTLFKGWTIDMILRHLHVWNHAAQLSLTSTDEFNKFFALVVHSIHSGTLTQFETDYLEGLAGPQLRMEWQRGYEDLADAFAGADPTQRVAWAGPSMSARSSITARLMEVWAHGQAVYDVLGLDRASADDIRNIVVLGVNTFGWTFKNRKLAVPDTMPFLHLTAPSGDVWTFGKEQQDEQIVGEAEEFCQVITQTRNIADTQLQVTGPVASQWMAMAQCFAGRPEDPPLPGQRHKAEGQK